MYQITTKIPYLTFKYIPEKMNTQDFDHVSRELVRSLQTAKQALMLENAHHKYEGRMHTSSFPPVPFASAQHRRPALRQMM